MRTRIAFPLLLTLLCLSWTDRFAAAQDGHDFQICEGSFALCTASTCTPTGNKIRVNGTQRLFAEADCTCPIFSGNAIADLTGGNMQGSCSPPPNGTWSLFSLMFEIPQEINDWATSGPQALAPPLICPAKVDQGGPTGELLQLRVRHTNKHQWCARGDVSLCYGRIAGG